MAATRAQGQGYVFRRESKTVTGVVLPLQPQPRSVPPLADVRHDAGISADTSGQRVIQLQRPPEWCMFLPPHLVGLVWPVLTILRVLGQREV